MKRLLVTGASGFLGSRIIEYYKDRYEICTPPHTEMDITDQEQVFRIFHDFRPHMVIHSAAISDVGMCEREPERSRKINVDGSRNIAEASAKVRAKCLVCSSDQVYFGSQRGGPHKEDEDAAPLNVYGREKLLAEEECLRQNPECVILRLSWMYDTRTLKEGEHGDFFRTLVSWLQASDMISCPVNDVRGITDVNEVVRNFERCTKLEGGVYNFGSFNDRNTYETVSAMFEELGWDTARLRKDEEAFGASPRDISMDQEKLEKSGITFPSTVESLVRSMREFCHDTISWE